MWINLPEWLCIVLALLFLLTIIASEVLKHLNAKYAKNQAERELEKRVLDKEIAELELEKIRITTSSSGSSTTA